MTDMAPSLADLITKGNSQYKLLAQTITAKGHEQLETWFELLNSIQAVWAYLLFEMSWNPEEFSAAVRSLVCTSMFTFTFLRHVEQMAKKIIDLLATYIRSKHIDKLHYPYKKVLMGLTVNRQNMYF